MNEQKATAAQPDILLPPPPDGPVADIPQALKLVTLKELGPQLPVGILVGDKRVKPFRLRPFRMKEEKELGAIKGKKGTSFGDFVSGVMSTMLATVGPYSFDTMKPHERRLVVSQMTMADVLYTYLYLRYEALGPEQPIAMNARCSCSHQFTFDADLGSLEVRMVNETAIDLRRPYKLRDGLIVGGTRRDTVHLHPLLWRSVEHPDYSAAEKGQREALTIVGSIVGVDGPEVNPFVMTEAELDMMTKYDIEGITSDIEEYSPGPMMVVTCECPACKADISMMLNWAYDSFFARSSQRNRGNR